MKEYFFESGGLYYRKNDFKPDRATLVFVHGVSGSSSAWLPYEKKFEDKYNILTYDIRGHGQSKKYPRYEDYDIKKFAEDLRDLLSFLKISKFIFISNSFGGLIALEYLKRWPETVSANIFTSPEIYMNQGLSTKILRSLLKAATSLIGLMPFDPKPRGHIDYRKYPNSTDWDVGRNLADMRNTGLRAHFYTLRQSFLPEGEYGLEKIVVPTLIVHGEKDTMVPLKNSLWLAQKIKNCQFASLPGIDHNTVHNAVENLSTLIDKFINEQKSDKMGV